MTKRHKHALFPLEDKYSFEVYETLARTAWTHEALDYSKDRDGFLTLSDPLQKALLSILSFFAVADSIVNENLVQSVLPHVSPEARLAIAMQMGNEAVHAVTYNKLIDALVVDTEQKNELFNATYNGASVQSKVEYAMGVTEDSPLIDKLALFFTVEGLLFSSSFAYLFWLQDHLGTKLGRVNVNMPATFGSNEYIARDEALHTQLTAHLYNTMAPRVFGADRGLSRTNSPVSSHELQQAIGRAVMVETQFIDLVIPDHDEVMNKQAMRLHVQAVANGMCAMVGLPPLYLNVVSPFSSLVGASVPTNNSFFERRNTSYRKVENDNLTLVENF